MNTRATAHAPAWDGRGRPYRCPAVVAVSDEPAHAPDVKPHDPLEGLECVFIPGPRSRASGKPGDKWHRTYYLRAKPDRCELCGAVPTDHDFSQRWDGRGNPPVFLFWDHCHQHGIVRGALCHRCNTDEATDHRGRVAPWQGFRPPDRFVEWRMRCPECREGSGDAL